MLDDDGTVIGSKISLDYRVGKQPNGIKTNWLMKEYVVEGHKRQRLDKKDMKVLISFSLFWFLDSLECLDSLSRLV